MHRPRRRVVAAALALCTIALMAGLKPAVADPGVDLTIASITDTPDPVKEANVVRYKIVAQNMGLSTSQPIMVDFYAYNSGSTDLVTVASTDPMIESANGAGWTCVNSEGWYCDNGTLAPGQSSTPIFVYVRAPSQQTTITLYAHVHSADSELDPYNNDKTESTLVVLSSSCAGQVSCGSGFVRFDVDSFVTTGPLSATHWLVGTTHFKAVPGASDGIVYNMMAVHPTGICPVGGGPLKCTLQMNIDPIPAVYPVGNVKLTLLCHPIHCPPGPLGTLTLLMFIVGANGISTPILHCLDGLSPNKCFVAKRLPSGALKIVVRNLSAGDPKIAGRCIGGC